MNELNYCIYCYAMHTIYRVERITLRFHFPYYLRNKQKKNEYY